MGPKKKGGKKGKKKSKEEEPPPEEPSGASHLPFDPNACDCLPGV